MLADLTASTLIGLSYLAPVILVVLTALRTKLSARAFLLFAVVGLQVALIGTLGHGTSSVVAILTASIVIEAILFAPILLVNRPTRHYSIRQLDGSSGFNNASAKIIGTTLVKSTSQASSFSPPPFSRSNQCDYDEPDYDSKENRHNGESWHARRD